MDHRQPQQQQHQQQSQPQQQARQHHPRNHQQQQPHAGQQPRQQQHQQHQPQPQQQQQQPMPHMAPQPVQPGPNMQVPNQQQAHATIPPQQPIHQHQQHSHHHPHQQQQQPPPPQPNNGQHNYIQHHHHKLQPQSQQPPMASPQQMHQSQHHHPQQHHHHPTQHNQGQQPAPHPHPHPHHLTQQHNQNQPPTLHPHHHIPQQHNQNQPPTLHHMHMSLPQSMAPQHWVGPHPPQGQPPQSQHHPLHSQQQQHQQQQQPQPHHQPPQQHAGHHHMNQAHGPSVVLGQYSNPNFHMYPPPHMGHPHPFVGPPGHPAAAAAPFEHHPAPPSHQQDSINLPQQTPQQQNQPPPPPPQQQQQQQPHAVSISNHLPSNNVVTNQLSNAPIISTSTTTGVTSIHPMTSSPMMDPHMANRITMNQAAYSMMGPYMGPPYGLVMPQYMHDMNHYPGPPLPPNAGPPVVGPLRVPGDLGMKPHFEPQAQIAPIPPTSTISQAPGGKPTSNVPPPTNLATPMTPLPPIKPRKRTALAIVDPHTKHVFTVDELKGSPSTPQSQSSKDSGVPEISSKEPSISDKDPSSSEENTAKSSVADSTSGDVSAAEITPVKEVRPAQKTTEVETKSEEAMVVTETNSTVENGDSKSQPDDLAKITETLASIKVSSDEKPSSESKEDNEETPKKKTLSNLPYAKDQYSPANPNGKKRYSIDFLKAIAKEMNIELDNTFSSRVFDFTPHYAKSGGHYSMPQQPMMRRSSQQVPNKPRKVITTHSLQQEVELNTAEKPWKPELEAEKSKIIETGEMDTSRLLKVFRGHLNKLTPQKYDSLIEKIGLLDLNSDERLQSVIDLVFDKAVDEPGFCELYARMCKVIASKDQKFSFHLVKKCQEEFETADLYTGLRVDERKLEIEDEQELAKKKLLSEELYEDMRLRRKKYLGTIKLIGEMYKLGLLLPKIIGLCMNHLIAEATNENVECLCSLITTVGANLSQEGDPLVKDALSHTLHVLHEIANAKKTDEFALESRIKFKILDTIDLSRRRWRPRMVENNPKKIEEIREEAQKEVQKQNQQNQQHHHNHSNQSRNVMKNNDRDERDRQPRKTNFLNKKW